MTLNKAVGLMQLAGKKWTSVEAPKKILVIRLQAFGDVVITLPYLQSLKKNLPPTTQIDFLTRTRMCEIPLGLSQFNMVYVLNGGNNVKKEFLWYLLLFPILFKKRYDVVIDLQNHKFSQVIRKSLFPKSWVEFDRESKIYAGLRNKRSIDFLGLGEVSYSAPLQVKQSNQIDLAKFNLPADADFIVINPAGFFETRNWPQDYYISFCKKWMQEEKRSTYFLILGEASISKKAQFYSQNLGNRFIDLSQKTSPVEALQILSKASLVVSEDSGLFHMACAMGVPTIGIYGSTRNDWTNPMLPHTFCFNSSDLECGDCMREKCLFETVICLTRVLPEQVFQKALELVNARQK
jgi:ADP-heptose:LPS heptosyltransferase